MTPKSFNNYYMFKSGRVLKILGIFKPIRISKTQGLCNGFKPRGFQEKYFSSKGD